MIGDLRTKISIFKPECVRDDIGGQITRWVLDGKVWGHVSIRTRSDVHENGRVINKHRYLVIIRWQRDFSSDVRLSWRRSMARILSVSDPDLRRERLHIICEEEDI